MDPSKLLNGIPSGLRNELIRAYNEVCRNYVERRWEPAELNGGKFAEIAYTIIDGYLSGNFPASAKKPPNMAAACRSLESSPTTMLPGDRSMRVLIPRALITLYEIRNNRNVGHVGGDVDPNQMDSSVVHSIATWIMAELVRVFHLVDLITASQYVEQLVERNLPMIWDIGTTRRVMDPNLSMTEQSLLLLYAESDWLAVGNLVAWTEYSNASVYRARVLEPMHRKRLIEFDRDGDSVLLSPSGAKHVEQKILPRSAASATN